MGGCYGHDSAGESWRIVSRWWWAHRLQRTFIYIVHVNLKPKHRRLIVIINPIIWNSNYIFIPRFWVQHELIVRWCTRLLIRFTIRVPGTILPVPDLGHLLRPQAYCLKAHEASRSLGRYAAWQPIFKYSCTLVHLTVVSLRHLNMFSLCSKRSRICGCQHL
jgi:hypothetical protein